MSLSTMQSYTAFITTRSLMLPAIVAACLISVQTCRVDAAEPRQQSEAETQAADQESPETESADSWTEQEIVAAQQFGQQLSIAEWLGPMAPVALSPFFGITLLSGLAMFGGTWVAADNPLLGENSPLHHPAVFWTFLILTVLTSVPRFTKVSKPIAQALDQLEAWSGIITMVVLRILISMNDPGSETPDVVHAGVLSLSTDVLLIIAAGINIFVINAVKFFFEILIWITPIPFVDAAWEVLNKLFCLALMTLYAFSPTLATLLNLVLFAFSAVVLTWAHRREIFFRSMLLDALRPLFAPQEPGPELVVFPVSTVGKIKPRSRCQLARTSDGWTLTHHRFFRRTLVENIKLQGAQPRIHRGLFTNSIDFNGAIPSQLTFSRRFNARLDELSGILNCQSPDNKSPATLRTEFA
ncbi:MAG: hypothetical protein JNL58_29855 [Planctomyces sp.]|nr:hypothetical protein [Planctomyces sp.]